MKNCLAIDVGGSKILVGIVDETGVVLDFCRQDYPLPYSLDVAYNDIVRMATPLLKKYKPLVCGVSLPGPVNSRTGVCPLAPFLGIRDWHASKELSDLLGLPVFAENDANACAVAEKTFGKAVNVNDFLWLTISNGVGGALYLNGKLYSGANFCAGELGHVRVQEDGSRCSCGKTGCLESVASGGAISAFYKAKTGVEKSAQEIGNLAQKGDKIAKSAYKRLAKGLGRAIAMTATLLDVNVCYLGGGVAQSLEVFKDDLIEEINDKLFVPIDKTVKIEYSGLGYYASLCGAGAVAFRRGKTETECVVGDYLENTAENLMRINIASVAQIAEIIIETNRAGGTVFTVGNGGSASTASHIANDLIKGCRVGDETGIRAVCLSDSVPVVTCLANDFSYDDIFKIQLETLAKKGDILCLFSGSGNSENVVNVAKFAKSNDITVVGFLGKDGGKVRALCDYYVLSDTDSMEKIEDAHLAIEHAIVVAIRKILEDNKGGEHE